MKIIGVFAQVAWFYECWEGYRSLQVSSHTQISIPSFKKINRT